MLKKVLIGIVAVIALLLIYIQTRPAEFHIERSAQINAPQSVIFGYLNDFHKWSVWSPWEKLDPNLKREFSGPESGTGATYAWVGNDQVGSGKMTITESLPPEQVKIALEFIAPFAAKNRTTFSIRSSGTGSTVTWMMDGENDFMGKAFGAFMDMDSLVGKDFEAGLQNLKQAAEGEAKAQAAQAAVKAAEAKAQAEAAAAQAAAAAAAASANTAAAGAAGAP